MNPEDEIEELTERVNSLARELESIKNAAEETERVIRTHNHLPHDGTRPILLDSQDAFLKTLAVNKVAIASLGAAFTITPTSGYHTLTASAARTSSTTQAIKDGAREGQVLILEGTSDTNTITIKNSANTKLNADCTLGAQDVLLLIWNGSDWVEVGRKDPASATTPGGSTTQVQFNDAGAFGGDSAFTFDKDANYLELLGFLSIFGPSATGTDDTGDIDLVTGDVVNGTAGLVEITGGDSSGTGEAGEVVVRGGAASGAGGTPGDISLFAGAFNNAAGGDGANVTIQAGAGRGAGQFGGNLILSHQSPGSGALIGEEVHDYGSTEVRFRGASTSTTNATPANVTGAPVSIPENESFIIYAFVVARRTGGTAGTDDDSAAYIRSACYKDVAGTPTLVGAIQNIYTAEDQAGWDCTFVVSGTDVFVQVTGALNNNVSWRTEVKWMGVS